MFEKDSESSDESDYSEESSNRTLDAFLLGPQTVMAEPK